MRHALGWVCLLVLLCGGASGAAAQSVPSALQGWQEWVLHGHESQACPLPSAAQLPAGIALAERLATEGNDART